MATRTQPFFQTSLVTTGGEQQLFVVPAGSRAIYKGFYLMNVSATPLTINTYGLFDSAGNQQLLLYDPFTTIAPNIVQKLLGFPVWAQDPGQYHAITAVGSGQQVYAAAWGVLLEL